MNRQEIMEFMPHRGDMLLLDEAHVNDDGDAEATYTFRGNEWYFSGHFPKYPIAPGIMLCEFMAQTCCVLLKDQKGYPLYTGLDRVRFRTPVRPGDTVKSVCRIIRHKGPFYFARGKVTCGDKTCLTGEFSFAIIDADVSER